MTVLFLTPREEPDCLGSICDATRCSKIRSTLVFLQQKKLRSSENQQSGAFAHSRGRSSSPLQDKHHHHRQRKVRSAVGRCRTAVVTIETIFFLHLFLCMKVGRLFSTYANKKYLKETMCRGFIHPHNPETWYSSVGLGYCHILFIFVPPKT